MVTHMVARQKFKELLESSSVSNEKENKHTDKGSLGPPLDDSKVKDLKVDYEMWGKLYQLDFSGKEVEKSKGESTIEASKHDKKDLNALEVEKKTNGIVKDPTNSDLQNSNDVQSHENEKKIDNNSRQDR